LLDTAAPRSATPDPAVPHERSGMAGGAVNTFRQLGFALGVAVFGAVFTDRLTGRPDVQAAAADAVNHTVLAAGILALAGGVLVLLFVRAGHPQWSAPTIPAAPPTPSPDPAASHPR
jgi:hypothetical protein